MKQLNDSNRDLILGWLSRLSKHFTTELSEDQIDIFLNAMRKYSAYQISMAFERCLNECVFMPKLSEVHQRAPEEKEHHTATGAFVQQKPILDLVRPIAREICKEMTGREYDDLDSTKDYKLIFDVFYRANTIRYERMGLDTSKWQGQKHALNIKRALPE